MWFPAIGSIVVSGVLAALVVVDSKARLRNDLSADFSYESQEIAQKLVAKMAGYRQILRGSRSMMTVMGQMSQSDWQAYVANLFLGRDYSGMETVGFAPHVAADRLEVHEKRVRGNAFPDYKVKSSGQGAFFAPVARLEASQGLPKGLIGLDLLGEPALAAAMDESARTGTTVLSAPVVMPDLPGNPASPAVFMFQPLYQSASSRPEGLASDATPSKKVSGWVFGAFRVDDMLVKTLAPLPPNMGLQVFYGSSTASASQIYEKHSELSFSSTSLDQIEVRVPISLDGQTWTLQFTGLPRAYTAGQGAVSRDLIAILMICGLFGVSAVLATLMHDKSLKLTSLAEELKQSNDRYQFLATHDALTKVANRVLFQRTIDSMVSEAERYGQEFSLIYIDLDKFKQINDLLGHEAGDLVLIEATRRMVDTLRETDMIARRGGDEFVLLLPHIGDLATVAIVAQKICDVLANPIRLGEAEGCIAGSLGIARYPYDGKTSESLIQQADQRMYRAKQRGGSCWVATDDEVSANRSD